MSEVSESRLDEIDDIVAHIAQEYGERPDSRTLKRIGREEFHIGHYLRVPLTQTACVGWGRTGYVVFYHGYGLYERFVLGHEIGHVALGHVGGKRTSMHYDLQEEETNYFSMQLTGISPPVVNALDAAHTVFAILTANTIWRNLKQDYKTKAREVGAEYLLSL